MARPRSEDKHNAILAAAAQVFSERGLGASTSSISSTAGVAEGTLFTYFPSKGELINVLYREIKLELAGAMMSNFPRRTSLRHRLQHVWNHYVDWGVANPVHHKVLRQIELWGGLTEESKTAGQASFGEIQTMAEDAIAQHIFQRLPEPFFAAILTSMAETTMTFMRQHPQDAEMYRTTGFATLWAGITRK